MTTLEATFYRVPLAFQFVDSVGGAGVCDGLVVTAWPAGDAGAACTATASPVSTIMGFGWLPGLASYDEVLTDDPATFSWSPPAPSRPFEVRVADPLGRYLTEVIAVELPAPALLTTTLYSAPTRPAPGAFGAVYGEVWSTATSEPASWAMVQLVAGPNTYTAMADALGRYTLYFPYPEALPPLTGSPPSGGPLTWPLTVSVNYQPSVQNQLADSAAADPPELGSLLGQAAATISTGGGTQASVSATLAFGTPLLLMLQVVPA